MPGRPTTTGDRRLTPGGTLTTKHAQTKSIADVIADVDDAEYVAVTFDSCANVEGPFFHGTKTELGIDDLLTPGHRSNYHHERIANHVYFAGLVEAAVWGAELAVALGGSTGREHVYVVEPTGPFEDDPNVTNQRFPGNVTRSYRTRHPVRIVGELEDWERHTPAVLQGMLDNIAQLRAAGHDIVLD